MEGFFEPEAHQPLAEVAWVMIETHHGASLQNRLE